MGHGEDLGLQVALYELNQAKAASICSYNSFYKRQPIYMPLPLNQYFVLSSFTIKPIEAPVFCSLRKAFFKAGTVHTREIHIVCKGLNGWTDLLYMTINLHPSILGVLFQDQVKQEAGKSITLLRLCLLKFRE